VKINGIQHYLWQAVDYEGEALECFVTKKRDTRCFTVLKEGDDALRSAANGRHRPAQILLRCHA